MTSTLMESVAGCLEVEAFRVAARVEAAVSEACAAILAGDGDRAHTAFGNAAALADFAASVTGTIERIRSADQSGGRDTRAHRRRAATGSGARETDTTTTADSAAPASVSASVLAASAPATPAASVSAAAVSVGLGERTSRGGA